MTQRLFILLLAVFSLSMIVAPVDQVEACLTEFNRQRADLGYAPLVMHDALVAEARRHIAEMKSHKSEYDAQWGLPIADIGWSDVEPPFGWSPFEPWVNMSLRACHDEWAASDLLYPCRATTWLADREDHDLTGWIAGVSAMGSREGRSMCKVWPPIDVAILNPKFIHVGIGKSGKMWSTFLGWPETVP